MIDRFLFILPSIKKCLIDDEKENLIENLNVKLIRSIHSLFKEIDFVNNKLSSRDTNLEDAINLIDFLLEQLNQREDLLSVNFKLFLEDRLNNNRFESIHERMLLSLINSNYIDHNEEELEDKLFELYNHLKRDGVLMILI
jgi:hypothetical protein